MPAPLIADIRKAKGIDQQTLAAQAGISRPTLTSIEQGRQVLLGETRNKIAAALGVAPSDLTEQEAAPAQPEHPWDRARRLGKELSETLLEVEKTGEHGGLLVAVVHPANREYAVGFADIASYDLGWSKVRSILAADGSLNEPEATADEKLAELAENDFEPLTQDATDTDVVPTNAYVSEHIMPPTRLALVTMFKTKAELVETCRALNDDSPEGPGEDGNLLTSLVDGIDFARNYHNGMATLCAGAHARLMTAVAVLATEEGGAA